MREHVYIVRLMSGSPERVIAMREVGNSVDFTRLAYEAVARGLCSRCTVGYERDRDRGATWFRFDDVDWQRLEAEVHAKRFPREVSA